MVDEYLKGIMKNLEKRKNQEEFDSQCRMVHYCKRYTDAVENLPQTQAMLNDQLDALHSVAIKLGLYDAADFLKTVRRNK